MKSRQRSKFSLMIAVVIMLAAAAVLSSTTMLFASSSGLAWDFDDPAQREYIILGHHHEIQEIALEYTEAAAYEGGHGLAVTATLPANELWFNFGVRFDSPQDWTEHPILSFDIKAIGPTGNLGRYASVFVSTEGGGEFMAVPTTEHRLIQFEPKEDGWFAATLDLRRLVRAGWSNTDVLDLTRVVALTFNVDPSFHRRGEVTIYLDNVRLTGDAEHALPVAEDFIIGSRVMPGPQKGVSTTPFLMSMVGRPPWQQLAAVVFQGLANRELAQLYLLWETSDLYWLEQYRAIGYEIQTETVHPDRLPELVLGRLGENVRGILLYDETIFDDEKQLLLVNVLTAISAVEQLIPLPESRVDGWDLPVLFDARDLWSGPDEAYRWVIETYPELVDKGPLAHLHPTVLTMRDYLVAHKILPIFYWDGMSEETDALFHRVLLSTGANQPIIGIWNIPQYKDLGRPAGIGNEHTFLRLISQYAKFLIPVGEEAVPNLTYHSGLAVDESELRSMHLDRLTQGRVPLEDDKVYVTFNVSDGDNVYYLFRREQFPGIRWWDNHARGQETVSWTIAPALLDLMPGVLNYYYKTATPKDTFTVGLGYGYILTNYYGLQYANRDELLHEFFRATGAYMDRLGLTGMFLITDYNYSDQYPIAPGRGLSDMEIIAQASDAGVILLDYHARPNVTYETSQFMAADVPVFHALTQGVSVDEMVQEIKTRTDGIRPAFVHAFVENWRMTTADMLRVAQQLGPDYVFVDAQTLGDLYAQHRTASGQ